MELEIPLSLRVEHNELHAELVQATQAPGKVGEAAREVARALHPHFVREEEFALPPLGLLSALAQGQVTPEMRGVLAKTDRLKVELPRMLEEHRSIAAALETLKQVAREEGAEGYADLAERLMLHAQTEEEVMYPATILIGEYLKLKLFQAP